MFKDLDFYMNKMRLFPSVIAPKTLGHDGEFIYYQMVLPRDIAIQLEKMSNAGLLDSPDAMQAFKLTWYPVYQQDIAEINKDSEVVFYKVKVPKIFVDSGLGVVYRGYDIW